MSEFGSEENKSKRPSTGLIVGIVLGLLVTCCVVTVVCAMGIVGTVFGAMRQSEPYQVGVERAVNDTAVVEALGAPIEPAFLFSGSVEQDLSGGFAELQIPLEGSRASGTLYVSAIRVAGTWEYTVLELVIDSSGERIDLLSP